MRAHVLAGLALAAAVPTAASAGAPGEGPSCGFNSISHPLNRDRQVGDLEGGPIVVAEPSNPLRTGRLVCTIRANGDTHLAEERASARSVTTAGAVVLTPTLVDYQAADTDVIVLCTSVEIDGEGTYYLEGADGWSTDPSVSCAVPL